MRPDQVAKQLFEDYMEEMDIQYPPNAKYMAIRCVNFSIERIKAMYLKNYANTVDFKATSAHSNEIKFLNEILKELDKL
jgi:hypothetical protein